MTVRELMAALATIPEDWLDADVLCEGGTTGLDCNDMPQRLYIEEGRKVLDLS